ncbi:cation-dependent mannose-6-phosphate receptor-like [Glandiceps talaboti]
MGIFQISSKFFEKSLRRTFIITCGLLSLSLQKVTTQVTCISNEPCKCKLSDGSGELDLTSLAGNSTNPTFSGITGGDGDKYWFDPCVDFSVSGPANNSCTDVRVCRYAVDQDNYFSCGSSEPEYVYFEQNNSITLIYNNSEEGVALKLTSVVVKCIDTSTDKLIVYGRDTNHPELYNMTLESKYGCLVMTPPPPPPPSYGVSAGTMLIVIVLSAFILYCGVGCLFHRTVYGAQGTDQIPHYVFWSSLPGLIKDGWLFATERCRQTKEPEGYDSL